MIIGVPTEIKPQEHRVGAVPAMVHALVEAGHSVLVQEGAGHGAGLLDDDFVAAGASIVPSAKEVFDRAEMIIKVKEPLPEEYDLIR